MNHLSALYKPALALLTDLYQLTMAYGYWKTGIADRKVAFHLSYRKNPFRGGYAIACGLATAIEYVRDLRFGDTDMDYLATLVGADGRALFEPAFLEYLCALDFDCDLDAIPEGTVVFPQEPLVRVTGSILQAQLLETALLNMINFATLVATKAARVVQAAAGAPVLEFGLRRAQGVDGGVSASRAAYIGGCAGTSNVLAGKLYGIPVKGTHAHSWVMCFDSELEAFEKYAEVMPNNCLFLVDTYDSLEGTRHAVEVAAKLRRRGHEMLGIRLDSGDLAYLSRRAREILDAGGFPDAAIVASNDLDEIIIESLRQQGAPIGLWGVGTKLATAHDDPALGGVYKLSAVQASNGAWEPRIKLSDHAAKATNPGVLQVRRCYLKGAAAGDMIYDVGSPPGDSRVIVDPTDSTRRKQIPEGTEDEDLLVPVFRRGRCVYEIPDIHRTRERAREQLACFHEGIKRFVNPHEYPVGLDLTLHHRRNAMIMQAKGYEP